MKKFMAAAALGGFVLSGPLQYAGLLPITAFGDASLSTIAVVLDATVAEAVACGNGNGNGKGNGKGGGRR